jgi:hypothetical protein
VTDADRAVACRRAVLRGFISHEQAPAMQLDIAGVSITVQANR